MIIQGIMSTAAAEGPLFSTPVSPLPFGEVMSNLSAAASQRAGAGPKATKPMPNAPSAMERDTGAGRPPEDTPVGESDDASEDPSTRMAAAPLQQAFTFSQLGIFGLSGATGFDAGPAGAPAARQTSATATGLGGSATSPVADRPASPAVLSPPPRSEELTAAVGLEASPSSIVDMDADDNGGETVASSRMEGLAADATGDVPGLGEEPSSASNAGLPESSNATDAQVSVTASQQAGTLQVVAASANISTDAKIRLFQAIASLADEFGLNLADVTHNGVHINPALSAAEGANGS